jgi:probable rRNA maturation factor
MSTAPALVWSNRQRKVPPHLLQLPLVQEITRHAWPLVRAEVRRGAVLPDLPEIAFVLVSDRRLAALHDRFMNDPTPTDVITFHHGEIVISAEMARREAQNRRLPVPQEVARYAVHGLLHLAGWDDREAAAAAGLHLVQEKILRRASRGLC